MNSAIRAILRTLTDLKRIPTLAVWKKYALTAHISFPEEIQVSQIG
jgi:hypothetical protein